MRFCLFRVVAILVTISSAQLQEQRGTIIKNEHEQEHEQENNIQIERSSGEQYESFMKYLRECEMDNADCTGFFQPRHVIESFLKTMKSDKIRDQKRLERVTDK